MMANMRRSNGETTREAVRRNAAAMMVVLTPRAE
jgi:hypothetical protein